MREVGRKARMYFEVISDVLYLDGAVLHCGDMLNPTNLGARLIDLVALDMIRPVDRPHRRSVSSNLP
ncbi:MAG: hypothetical protein P4L46_09385 [Fimbriimonas sp.]|nr:hypothetical protein [Fimbriimonas sp.]